MRIERIDEPNKGKFIMWDGDAVAGKMTFSRTGSTRFIIDHTEVDDAYRGQGIGLQLLEAVVTYARSEELKVIPLCPYAQAQFRKHEELRDVLDR